MELLSTLFDRLLPFDGPTLMPFSSKIPTEPHSPHSQLGLSFFLLHSFLSLLSPEEELSAKLLKRDQLQKKSLEKHFRGN